MFTAESKAQMLLIKDSQNPMDKSLKSRDNGRVRISRLSRSQAKPTDMKCPALTRANTELDVIENTTRRHHGDKVIL